MSNDKILKTKSKLKANQLESRNTCANLALRTYDLDLEFEIFNNTSTDDHLNSSIDLQKFNSFYKQNSKPNKLKSICGGESCSETPDIKTNLHSINSYRTRELSWSVKYMAMINQCDDNSNLVLVNNNFEVLNV